MGPEAPALLRAGQPLGQRGGQGGGAGHTGWSQGLFPRGLLIVYKQNKCCVSRRVSPAPWPEPPGSQLCSGRTQGHRAHFLRPEATPGLGAPWQTHPQGKQREQLPTGCPEPGPGASGGHGGDCLATASGRPHRRVGLGRCPLAGSAGPDRAASETAESQNRVRGMQRSRGPPAGRAPTSSLTFAAQGP